MTKDERRGKRDETKQRDETRQRDKMRKDEGRETRDERGGGGDESRERQGKRREMRWSCRWWCCVAVKGESNQTRQWADLIHVYIIYLNE